MQKNVVLSGKEIFKLVDQNGLPLDIIILELRERNAAFDLSEFIGSAKKAGWKQARVRNMVLACTSLSSNSEFTTKFDMFLGYHYKTT